MGRSKLGSRRLAEILRRFREGTADGADFELLFKGYYARVFGLFRGARPRLSKEDCEDLTQQTFFKVYRGRSRIPERPDELDPWIYTIARRTHLGWLERATRQKRGGGRSDEALEREPRDPEVDEVSHAALEQLIKDERKRRLHEAIHGLSAQRRRCVILRVGRGMTVAEIAGELDLATGTVKAHLHQALEALRKDVGDAFRVGNL